MASVRKIKLNICSLIENLDSSGLPEGDVERDSIDCIGELLISDESFTISYTERREGGEVNCLITESRGELTVKRTGAVESEMHFAVGKPYCTLYKVPPFSFDMKIETLRLTSTVSDKGGEINLLYKMTVGGAAKKTKMKITAEIKNES